MVFANVMPAGLEPHVVKVSFAIAKAVYYQNMIFGDFNDVFYKLPVKVLMTFEWSQKHLRYDFLLKKDDYVFVIPNTLNFLSAPDIPKTRLHAVLIVSILKSNQKDVSSNHIKIKFLFKEIWGNVSVITTNRLIFIL